MLLSNLMRHGEHRYFLITCYAKRDGLDVSQQLKVELPVDPNSPGGHLLVLSNAVAGT